MCLDQVVSGPSENSLWLGYRSTDEDYDRWRCQGGDVRDAHFALALLLVLPARRGTRWACSAGVLGSSRCSGAAGSSPATSSTCLQSCCSGAAGVAILGIVAQSDGCAGAGAGGRSAWMSAATQDASTGSAGHHVCHTRSEIQIWPSPDNHTPTTAVQILDYYICYKVGI